MRHDIAHTKKTKDRRDHSGLHNMTVPQRERERERQTTGATTMGYLT